MSVAKIALIAALATIAVVTFYHSHSNKSEELFTADPLHSEYLAFKAKYNKQYGGPEDVKRFTIFKTNKAIIDSHNTVERTYTVGVNQFADLTNEEFSAIYLGFRGEAAAQKNTVNFTAGSNPEAVDHRDKSVNAVKNQAQCGSCWAFSTVAALEGLQALNGELLSFSEQQLVDCSTQNNGCNGGLMDYAFAYVAQKGIQSEESYGYKGVDSKCKYDADQVVFKNGGYQDVPANNWQALETAAARQVVSVAIEADRTPFQYYTGGVINDVACGTSLDHGVAVVGYTADAWIVRNSWGPSWGESGYVRIAKGDQANGAGICGINKMASYPTA